VPSSTTSDTVAALRRFIAHGSHQPGAGHLVEAGVLESRRGSGTYVCAFDHEEVFAVRLRLEPFAARLAAEQADRAAAAELRALLHELGARTGDPDGFAEADHAIHHAVALMSGNRILVVTLERLTDLTALSRSVTSPRVATAATLERMRALVEAIADRDGPGAEAAMCAHLEQVRATIAAA
jgi:DNA-binding FadR family transcriptional regulator